MNGNVVRVHRPVITPGEHARRMEEIKKAAARLIVAAEATKLKGESYECNRV